MTQNKKKNSGINLPRWVWLVLSLGLAVVVWVLISYSEGGSVMFAKPWEVFEALKQKLGFQKGSLYYHVSSSLFRVLTGFGIAFLCSIPIAFLMAWYKPFRFLVEPWIQFIRNIPPLAYIPLVVLGAGVGEESKIIVIFIAAFLTLVVTIYQGVLNVDQTLIKAAKVLGAKDRDIFFKIIIPASTPYILIGTRLGLSASLTTLIAAELTGASRGVGMMTQQAAVSFDTDILLLGIIVIGVLGITFEKIVKTLERKLTGWQEKIQ